MSVVAVDVPRHRLPGYALFAAMLAAAGLPLYIHAPKFYVDSYGVSLATLGGVLFALRLLDVVQDPLLGRLAARMAHRRAETVAVGLVVIGGAMVGLFAVAPPVAPILWFALMLTLVFSAFSFLTITFYAQGVAKASELGATGHLRVARWRETGALLGVCVAAIAPVALAEVSAHPFAVFAAGFAALAMVALVVMRPEWGADGVANQPATGFGHVLRDRAARRLLIVAFLNAAPVAVSSTLFLFFVESRLAAPGQEGWLLLLFFLSAAAAAPIWSRAAETFGAKRVLFAGMALSIAAFAFALGLGAGDTAAFAAICVASGAALGADMTLLPAMFARRMATVSPSAAEGFGLWAFVTKFTLAFAAAVLLPALDIAGFQPGADNTPQTLWLLTLFYAGLPCLLKSAALVVLATTDLEET
jgi:GPH family glycoside/pentoside/hexuronide:cation symporter